MRRETTLTFAMLLLSTFGLILAQTPPLKMIKLWATNGRDQLVLDVTNRCYDKLDDLVIVNTPNNNSVSQYWELFNGTMLRNVQSGLFLTLDLKWHSGKRTHYLTLWPPYGEDTQKFTLFESGLIRSHYNKMCLTIHNGLFQPGNAVHVAPCVSAGWGPGPENNWMIQHYLFTGNVTQISGGLRRDRLRPRPNIRPTTGSG